MRLLQRQAGVVLHLTSLPGPHGCGDLGAAAHRFVDWLASAGQSLWQVLPVNPVGPGDSPYQSPSAFAGNPLLVALEPLVQRGWLRETLAPHFNTQRVDYANVMPWRMAQLRTAAAGFFAQTNAANSAADHADHAAFADWRRVQDAWLHDWCLFAALKDLHQGQPWWTWAPALAQRDTNALATARRTHAQAIEEHAFIQWCFDEQISALKAHAQTRGVRLMGDLPIFVAHDSADCWARPDLYFLDDQHQPTFVAGVPPDGFTPDGQRWGNPLYRWDRMAGDGFAWWVARVQRALGHAHIFRIDHFRGFAGYWEVPAACPTAREGRWAPGPGKALFAAIESSLGPLPIVAEDLGTITPDVIDLRDHFGFPGMRILQEAFGGHCDDAAGHPFLPHHYIANGLAYTSTHDSDTAAGWWHSAPAAHRTFATAYLGLDPQCSGATLAQALIRAACLSVANLALYPLQDVLGLDTAHRMNLPGTSQGNWAWRFEWHTVGADVAPALTRLAVLSGRAPRAAC
jgi:4-alpha-glucanotransferase